MKKILFIISSCLTVTGILISLLALTSCEFNFKKMRDETTVQDTETISEEFYAISIDNECGFFDITVKHSEDGSAAISYERPESTEISYEIKNGTLTVRCIDNLTVFEQMYVGVSKAKLTISVPEKKYGDVDIYTASGNVKIDGITADGIEINTASGDVRINGITAKSLGVDMSSADVYISNTSLETLLLDGASSDVEIFALTASGKVEIDLSSGETEIKNSNFGSYEHECGSGDVELENVNVSGKLEIDCSSGEIEFSRLDAGEIDINTGSGDVEGTLLSPKNFRVDTSSGEVRVPASDSSAGLCAIDTGSGDIEIRIVD